MKQLFGALCALAVVVAGSSAQAQTPPPAGEIVNTTRAPTPDAPASAEVVVTGERPRTEVVKSFVDDITATSLGGKVARWDRRICPGVVGIQSELAQQVIDRLATIAFSVGLDIGEPGCRADILIIAAADGQEFTKQAVDDNPRGFGRWQDGVSRGSEALQDFIDTPRPVRWWHLTETRTSDGFGYERGRSVKVREVSRLRTNVREQFDKVIIIIDAKSMQGVSFPALTDFLAMVSLAQVSPNADVSNYPTILRLFAPMTDATGKPFGLTEWDLAYLNGLYQTEPNARNEADRKRRIAESIVDDAAVKR